MVVLIVFETNRGIAKSVFKVLSCVFPSATTYDTEMKPCVSKTILDPLGHLDGGV